MKNTTYRVTGGSRGCGHCCRVNHGECSGCSLQWGNYNPALAVWLISDKITRGKWSLTLLVIIHVG